MPVATHMGPLNVTRGNILLIGDYGFGLTGGRSNAL